MLGSQVHSKLGHSDRLTLELAAFGPNFGFGLLIVEKGYTVFKPFFDVYLLFCLLFGCFVCCSTASL
jgi:hypothetical protein